MVDPLTIGAAVSVGTKLWHDYDARKRARAQKGTMDRMRSSFKEAQARSGMNAHNVLMKSGTSAISRNQSRTIEELRDRIGREPGLLAEMIAKVGDTAGAQHMDLAVRGATMRERIERQRADRQFEFDQAMANMESAQTEAEAERNANLITNLVGGGLSLLGSHMEGSEADKERSSYEDAIGKILKRRSSTERLWQMLLDEDMGGGLM